ncbi:hypothetical protein [Bradyrhizobium elkanii]|uniref:hypothetical protein n=1 Tax=Bradyrhizobium elkanii TaxID=29448 RepID=UPI0038379F70
MRWYPGLYGEAATRGGPTRADEVTVLSIGERWPQNNTELPGETDTALFVLND